jgi:hypothetical protein
MTQPKSMTIEVFGIDPDEEDIECPHCEGSKDDPSGEWEYDEFGEPEHRKPCEVCCGFGILNW